MNGDMPFEGGSQGWKVQVAVDAAEVFLAIRFFGHCAALCTIGAVGKSARAYR